MKFDEEFYIECKNESEFKYYQQMFFKNNIYWADGTNEIIDYKYLKIFEYMELDSSIFLIFNPEYNNGGYFSVREHRVPTLIKKININYLKMDIE